MHGLAGMTPEDAVDIRHRFAEQLFELLGMGFKGGKVLFPGPALVGDDHDPAFLKGVDGREMLPETLVIKNKVGGGVDGGVEIEPEEDCFSFSSQFPDRSNRHPYLLYNVTKCSGL